MPKNGILRNVDAFYKREGEVGYSTNGYLVIEDLLNRREKVDKVMIFTDTQLWNSNGTRNSFEDSWNQYKSFTQMQNCIFLTWRVTEDSLWISDKTMYTLSQAGPTKFSTY